MGVNHLVVLPPTPDVLNLTAEAFWQILRDDVRPTHMIEGETFNFGKGRGGGPANTRPSRSKRALWQAHQIADSAGRY